MKFLLKASLGGTIPECEAGASPTSIPAPRNGACAGASPTPKPPGWEHPGSRESRELPPPAGLGWRGQVRGSIGRAVNVGGTLRITRRAGGGSQIPREGRERRDGAGDTGQRISAGHSGAGGTSSGEGPAGRAPPARGAACSAWNPAATGPVGRGFHPGRGLTTSSPSRVPGEGIWEHPPVPVHPPPQTPPGCRCPRGVTWNSGTPVPIWLTLGREPL